MTDLLLKTGESPLFFAAERDVEAVVDILINAGADVNQARSTVSSHPLLLGVSWANLVSKRRME